MISLLSERLSVTSGEFSTVYIGYFTTVVHNALALMMCVVLGDYMLKEDHHIISEVFSTAAYYSGQDFASSLARTLVIYTTIARDKDLFEKNEFFDVNEE